MSVTQTDTAPVVLLIDEERETRLLLRIIMEGSGYRVFDAATGKEGIFQTAQRRPSVILLDPGLPDLDGLEVLKRIREWSSYPS